MAQDQTTANDDQETWREKAAGLSPEDLAEVRRLQAEAGNAAKERDAPEQPNAFQRIAQWVNGIIRPDTTAQDLRLAQMIQQAQAAEDQRAIEDARAEATESLSNLRNLTQNELQKEFTRHNLDPAEIPDHPDRSWQSNNHLTARVDQDVAHLAQHRGHDLDTKEAKIAAYLELEETYYSIGLEIRLDRDFETQQHSEPPEPEDERIVSSERWQFSDEPGVETRRIVVQTEAGYHPGYEESYMGGDGPVIYSEAAFDNLAKERTLAWSYEDGHEEGLARASQTYDAAVQTITDLSHNEKLSIGQQAQLLDALSEIEIGTNQIRVEDTSKLSAWSGDPDDRERLAGLIDSHRDQLRYSTGIQQEVDRVGVDRHDAAAIDAYVQQNYGSEEAIIRQFRVSEALENIGHAVRDGQIPMFQNQEHMTAFRNDLEQSYGSGTFDRLLAGNDRDLEKTIPQVEFRQQISQGLSGMVQDAERHSSAEMEVNHAIAALDRRMARADWYAHFSDDSTVRVSGAREVSALVKDVSEFAAQSPAAAERISQSWDQRAPREMSKFPGYLPESERTSAVAQGNDAGNALSADQDRER